MDRPALQKSEWTFAAAIKRSTLEREVKAETKQIVLLEKGKAVFKLILWLKFTVRQVNKLLILS